MPVYDNYPVFTWGAKVRVPLILRVTLERVVGVAYRYPIHIGGEVEREDRLEAEAQKLSVRDLAIMVAS
jgi:hypothetical protein